MNEATVLRREILHRAILAEGCGSLAAARAMTALAEIELDRQRYLDGEPLLIIARSVLLESGAGDALLTPVLDGLARVAQARGDYLGAEHWAEQAVARGGDAPPSASLRALGAALTAEQRFDEAERVLREAIQRDRAEAGDDALPTARSLSQLANLYLRAQRFAEALPLIEQATRIDQERLGPNHPFIVDDFYDLGLAYEGLKRAGEAERCFLIVLRLLQRGENLRSPRGAYAQIELARILRARGDEDDAKIAEGHAHRILRAAEKGERRRERQV